MPVAFGGIAVGVLIGYPFGGAAYQLLGKSAPFILIAALISLNIGKLFSRLICQVDYFYSEFIKIMSIFHIVLFKPLYYFILHVLRFFFPYLL